jgi:hypothetical protein
MDTRILYLGWKCVVSFTHRLLYPQGKSSRYPLDRRLDKVKIKLFLCLTKHYAMNM